MMVEHLNWPGFVQFLVCFANLFLMTFLVLFWVLFPFELNLTQECCWAELVQHLNWPALLQLKGNPKLLTSCKSKRERESSGGTLQNLIKGRWCKNDLRDIGSTADFADFADFLISTAGALSGLGFSAGSIHPVQSNPIHPLIAL